jgi:hypothetical protein
MEDFHEVTTTFFQVSHVLMRLNPILLTWITRTHPPNPLLCCRKEGGLKSHYVI